MFSQFSPVQVEGKAERYCSAITFDNQTRSKTMKRITFAVGTALILGAITLALPKLKSEVKANPVAKPAAPQLIPGPKTCRNVKFRFKNNRSDEATIRIEKVSYYLGGVGNKTELVHTSSDCRYGSTCTTTGDDLPDADGRSVTSVNLVYKYLPKTVGASWSDLVQTPDQPNVGSTTCSDNKTYGTFYIPPQ
jgi:hypothetical protein